LAKSSQRVTTKRSVRDRFRSEVQNLRRREQQKMKKTVLTFGLISGFIMIAMMTLSLVFSERIGFGHSLTLGYTILIAGSLLVFFGIRSYRENIGGGQISFGRAFAVGILITLVASVCYVVAWEIIYFKFMPDFADKYAAYMIEKARAAGESAQKIQAIADKMKSMKATLDNPFLNAAFSFLEPFPIGLIVTLISAAILRKKAARQAAQP
jgi:cation transport ATPase